MLKKISVMLLAVSMLLALTACGEKKTLHCDNCNAEVEVDADSNMDESWAIYCDPCNEELLGDGIVSEE